MTETTIEITNYCPHECDYCSSNSTISIEDAIYLDYGKIHSYLRGKHFDIIHLSGGEPLSHPEFYQILELCKRFSSQVIVHTNALTHIAYNCNVLDGIHVDALLNVPTTVDTVKILKRVEQGREKIRPGVTWSRNWEMGCECSNTVLKPNGKIAITPCRKDI
jgi:2-iminoacetate synthase ThiH